MKVTIMKDIFSHQETLAKRYLDNILVILLHHDFDHLDLKLVVMVVEDVDEDMVEDVDKEMVEDVDEEMVEDVEDNI